LNQFCISLPTIVVLRYANGTSNRLPLAVALICDRQCHASCFVVSGSGQLVVLTLCHFLASSASLFGCIIAGFFGSSLRGQGHDFGGCNGDSKGGSEIQIRYCWAWH
uniref:Uncharacterized protein n=1 Tax=Triticum urartu TaxID=4572 RepID=A0A8R7UI98_TRIUA